MKEKNKRCPVPRPSRLTLPECSARDGRDAEGKRGKMWREKGESERGGENGEKNFHFSIGADVPVHRRPGRDRGGASRAGFARHDHAAE